MTIRNASTDDILIIRDLAERIWWPTYGPLLDHGQITYMLSTLYSEDTLRLAMTDGTQQFILLYDENGPRGFASYGKKDEKPSVYKLHKLYVLPETQGKGYGKAMIDEVKSRVRAEGGSRLDLNVYRHNPALKFYEGCGFRIIAEVDIPLGRFTLNDYVMQTVL